MGACRGCGHSEDMHKSTSGSCMACPNTGEYLYACSCGSGGRCDCAKFEE